VVLFVRELKYTFGSIFLVKMPKVNSILAENISVCFAGCHRQEHGLMHEGLS
jgi:hypothetical protein